MAKSLLGFLSLVSSIMFNDNPPFVRVQFVKKIKYIWYKMIMRIWQFMYRILKTWKLIKYHENDKIGLDIRIMHN